MGEEKQEQRHKIKSKKLEFGVIILVAILAIIYFYPKVATFINKKQEATVRQTCRAFVQKVLEKSKEAKEVKPAPASKNADLQKIIQEVTEEINSKSKDRTTYCGSEKCPFCCTVEFDSKTNTVIVTGYDKTLEVLSRTVINPPSFVMYER